MNTPLPRSDILRLALAGGLGFWTANLAISLTPIAAEYRRALAIPYLPMLFEAALGGLLIGVVVASALVRFPAAVPARTPVRKALVLSLAALALVTVCLEVPAKLSLTTGDAVRWFVVGTVFNLVRILALGLVIGASYRRLMLTPARRPAHKPGAFPVS